VLAGLGLTDEQVAGLVDAGIVSAGAVSVGAVSASAVSAGVVDEPAPAATV